nr:hypothetical protein GCM10010200_081820 [Actinomadura rugatobispora]
MNAMPSNPAASAASARSTIVSCDMRICGRKRWKVGRTLGLLMATAGLSGVVLQNAVSLFSAIFSGDALVGQEPQGEAPGPVLADELIDMAAGEGPQGSRFDRGGRRPRAFTDAVSRSLVGMLLTSGRPLAPGATLDY